MTFDGDYPTRPIEVSDIVCRHLSATDTESIVRLLVTILRTFDKEQLLKVYEELTGSNTIDEMVSIGNRLEYETVKLTK